MEWKIQKVYWRLDFSNQEHMIRKPGEMQFPRLLYL